MEGVGLRVKNEGSGIKGGGWSYIYLRIFLRAQSYSFGN